MTGQAALCIRGDRFVRYTAVLMPFAGHADPITVSVDAEGLPIAEPPKWGNIAYNPSP
jgi:hypothetical protein